MLQEVLLPRLGQTVESAIIENWQVKEGDTVKKGDILLEITTDKATLEVESFVQGTVLKIYAEPGDEVPVEAVIAYVGDPDADEAPDEPPTPLHAVPVAEDAKPARPAAAAQPVAPAAPAFARPGRLLISPRAKKLAEREKVTPLAIKGTGPEGRIVEADVVAYAANVAELKITPTAREVAYQRGVDLLTVQADGRITKEDVEKARPLAGPAAAGVRLLEMTAARRIIGERMAQSKREAPHFYLLMDIDMTEAVAVREEMKAAGTKVSFNDFIIKAIAIGFEAVPMMNLSWVGGNIGIHDTMDVALAVSIDDGLMAPVVRGVERRSIAEIAAQTGALIEKARNKRLTPEEYEGGSITVSNLGMLGITNFLPIINPGQASILGVGKIEEKPVVVNGGVIVRKMMAVTLAIDHRIADGATAATFLQAVKGALESPRDSLG
ncbi:MAG: dihydrolipoamide acetyltransferase family protein [Planctomycetota bacterium]